MSENEMREIKEDIKDIQKDVKAIDKTLYQIDQTLAVNTRSLHDHMRRTELLEETTSALNTRLSDLEINKIESNAVKKWLWNSTVFIGKVVAGFATVAGLLAMLPSFITWLLKALAQ